MATLKQVKKAMATLQKQPVPRVPPFSLGSLILAVNVALPQLFTVSGLFVLWLHASRRFMLLRPGKVSESLPRLFAGAFVLFLGYTQQRLLRLLMRTVGITLPAAPQKHLNEFTKRQQTTIERPPYGRGLPSMKRTHWRDWLLEGRSAREMLEEMADSLMMEKTCTPEQLTLGQLTEAVRRCCCCRRWDKCLDSDEYWSEAQCSGVAMMLCRDANILPAKDDGTATITPIAKLESTVPHYIGTALTVAMIIGRNGLNMFGLKSRWIDVPNLGHIHIYDSGEPDIVTGPPMVLQHGACTTGASMAAMAGMMMRGRRMIIPDLMDFDYSYSSTPERAAQLPEHIEQTVAVIQWCHTELGAPQVDLCGHSHGGHIIVAAAVRVMSLIRKVVLLCPGGLRLNQLFKTIHLWQGDPDVMAARMFPQLPLFAARAGMHYAQAAFKSPNMCNLLLSCGYDDYINFHTRLKCPVLLLWGTEDTILEPRQESVLLRDFPNSEGYWIQSGSHVLIADSLLTICPLIERFLAVEGAPEAKDGMVQRVLRFWFGWTQRPVRQMQKPPVVEVEPEALEMPLASL